ncbi:TPA: helix-turn-helix transcriptional regulator [Legionella pneumophila]|uniref:helix-turn-helix domain-containing protein n=1 Tax=Legionella pneumophila TaxID=446 RepID=UPI001A1EC4E2|nr:helix-turn-helix transcriptional regulator [Legionella pneumophila]MCZ4682227.1 helix-turn-helix transcriptional regulator [Legionella pneumophila]HAT1765772.1 helix-turn-helix transcriptional regulator [Legionella pneumophila]HAT3973793.1 helix-turn-helix transcriptional regulator [Legionella pneumophila]HAU1320142.1 helix-turn-helix transcriptional regulator [Legionella pneumophila]HAU2217867.1 helix-turn-helix transcriptional regulator [Legionella pneumophila]
METELEREHFVRGFARRLTALMQQADMGSSKSKAGVQINKLAEISGCSHQMARRYALGEALPDVDATYKIAKWLKVSPGWLLYGEEGDIPNNIGQTNLIQIEPELLEYILTKCATLFDITKNKQKLISYIMDIIHDATHIEADQKEILKVIDMSINSITRFHGINDDVRVKAG